MAKKPQIYIIPSTNGMKYILINFFLFIIALSFANNMALIVTFIMVSYFIIQMLETHRIIQDLDFGNLSTPAHYANSAVTLQAHYSSKIENFHYVNIQLLHGENRIDGNPTDLLNNSISYTCSPLKRGKYEIDKLKIYTYGKTKLFYVWKFIPVKQTLYIYPEQKFYKPTKLKLSENRSITGEINFKEHRRYSYGEPSHRIDWKLYAKINEVYLREYTFHEGETLKLEFNNIPGDKEEKLEILSYLVLNCYQRNVKWSLGLPTQNLSAKKTKSHFKNCMEALSVA